MYQLGNYVQYLKSYKGKCPCLISKKYQKSSENKVSNLVFLLQNWTCICYFWEIKQLKSHQMIFHQWKPITNRIYCRFERKNIKNQEFLLEICC